MNTVIVSACLLGEKVRYNGLIRHPIDPVLLEWKKQGRVLSFCPEISGGLPVPRNPVELVGGDGRDVLNGTGRCLSRDGRDYTKPFLKGAGSGLALVLDHQVELAVLKDGSPSCGRTYIYDGTFSGTKIEGKGVLAALLEDHGLPVFSEKEIGKAGQWLREKEAGRRF